MGGLLRPGQSECGPSDGVSSTTSGSFEAWELGIGKKGGGVVGVGSAATDQGPHGCSTKSPERRDVHRGLDQSWSPGRGFDAVHACSIVQSQARSMNIHCGQNHADRHPSMRIQTAAECWILKCRISAQPHQSYSRTIFFRYNGAALRLQYRHAISPRSLPATNLSF